MIIACGEALIDMVPLPEDPSTFQARPGGCPFNTAVAAARLGARVAFLGRVGSDFLGDRLAGSLAENGVDCGFLSRSPQPVTLAFVERGVQGERYAFYSHGAADRCLETADLPADLGPEASFLMVGSISLVQEPGATTIAALVEREAGRRAVSLDPNIRPSLVTDRAAYLSRLMGMIARSVIVKTSLTDLEWIFPDLGEEECVKRLLSMGPELVAVTRGAGGSMARTRRAAAAVPAPHVKVADTIGAGDSFHGALLYSLEVAGRTTRSGIAAMSREELERILGFCASSAALTCTRRGSDPPTRAEVEAFIRNARG